MTIPVIVRNICRLRTHGGHYGFGHMGGIDDCEPYQILVLEHRYGGLLRSCWKYEVRVWCALRKCPHWFNLGEDCIYNSLAAARDRAARCWMLWGSRGPGTPVASDPDFVDPRSGPRHDPAAIPSWAVGPLHVDSDPAWLAMEVGDDIASLLPLV